MVIYKTTNLIDGQFYVGKDKHNNPQYLGSGLKLINAIKKYGRCNFHKEILEHCCNEEELCLKEVEWIQKLNAVELGYNLAEGGAGGNTRAGFTKEEKAEYLKNMQKGRQNSEKVHSGYKNLKGRKRPEHSKKLKELYASGQLVPHNLGKITPLEVVEKIRKANRGKIRTEETKKLIAESKHKKVQQYTLEGVLIAEFESIKAASNQTEIGRDSISGCCTGKYRQGGGYRWEFKKDEAN
jgi:group I intron endonuclease